MKRGGGLTFKIGVSAEANDAGKEKFKQDILDAHNAYRDKHSGTPHLKWSDDLANKAQEWVNRIASDDRMYHQPSSARTNQGENLAGCWGEPMTGQKACDQWYTEITHYDFNNPYKPVGHSVGHFTQLVWKNTRELGAAMAISASGWKYVVARYRPAGNMRGGNKTNVLSLTDNTNIGKNRV